MVRSPGFKLRQRAALALALEIAFAAPVAVAGPSGASVANGQVTISQPSASLTQISASNGSIINWNQFSIGAGQVTRFIEPSSSSSVLNRVVGNGVSNILGALEANGHVFLINPNGVVIGVGARIDTNGFIASTLDMSDSDYLAGRLHFVQSGAAGSISNEGLISVGSGGQVALIAPNIENSGVIMAPNGQILLAAGRKVEIAAGDFEGVTFQLQAPTDSVINLGKLLADNGAIGVFASTLQQNGVIRADSMVQDAAGSIRLVASGDATLGAGSVTEASGVAGGAITIQSLSGTTDVSGRVAALGSGGHGGSIALLGERVAVEAGSTIDASGSSAGGQVLVGGDYQGRNAAVQDANMVYVGPGANLVADATGAGNGGRVIVWSNEQTQYYGSLSAKGGPLGGSGGFAEVSGKENLEFAGAAQLTATQGTDGTLLLDPLDIIVAANGGILPLVTSPFTVFQNNVVTISPAGLNRVGGNVVLDASRNVYFDTPTSFTGANLTVAAGLGVPSGSIFLTDNLSTTRGSLYLSGSTVSGSGTLTTAGAGSINLALTGGLAYSAAITTAGGAVSIATSAGSIDSTKINAGGGAVTLAAAAGGLSGNTITGGTVTLTSSGAQSDTVNAATRINATSTGSYVQLTNVNGQELRLGTINGDGGAYLYSNAGMTQAAGGSITAPFTYLSGESSAGTLGSAGAPLVIATPELELHSLGAPATIALSGSPTLNDLYLEGTVAALGATSITGAANLSSFSLANGGAALDFTAVAATGFSSGLTVHVVDGGISSSTLSLPGALTIEVAGAATLGTVSARSFSVTAGDAISVTSATTSAGGIALTAGSCNTYSSSCSNNAPITAGTLTSGGGGNIDLMTTDNGTLSVTTLNASGSATISGGYYAYYTYGAPRTSAITLGTATVGGSLDVTNYGNSSGAITAGAMTAGGAISLDAVFGAVALTTATSAGGGIAASAVGDITFQALTANGSGAPISLSSSTGAIHTTVDSAAADIVATGNVTLTTQDIATSGFIGDPSFTHPLVIQAGPTSTVTLDAGTAIGAPGKPVTVDTNGAINVASTNGQFFVTAENTSGTLQPVGTIALSASAAGMGAGGTSSFISKDLSIAATSDGSTVSIGNVVQSADNLNSFSFTASGSSALSFGNVNLTTTGNNQLLLTAGGAVSETAPGTNNVNAGNIAISGGTSGAVTLGNVTSSVAPGNVLTLSGGDITTLNLVGGSITVSGNNLALGTVSSTGTLSGYYTGYAYDPLLGYSTYITDEMHLTALGSLTTSGAITSATSAFVNAGNGISVAGGSGAITGGNSYPPYYVDTVTVSAGTGTLAASTISAYQVNVSGGTLSTGAISALTGSLNVSGTTLDTGNLTAPGNIEVSGTTFATGNIVAGGALYITATGAYQPGAIALSGSSASITAPGGINLTANGATLASSQVTFSATGGGVSANLTGTNSLTLVADGAVHIASTVPLDYLSMQLNGDQLGGASSITGTGQTFGMTTTGGTVANLDFNSPTTAIDLSYTELSPAVTAINLSSNLAPYSSFSLNAAQAAVDVASFTTNGNFNLSAAGDITLGSISTLDGSVSATSSTGNINVVSIVSGGGNVSLTSDEGSILKSGAGAVQIDAGAGGNPYGSVYLSAASGSVGAAGAPIVISNATSLSVAAQDAIALGMNATTLTNLSIVTSGSGTGAIAIANNPNFPGFTLTRQAGDLALGPVMPTNSGSFSLVATSGSILVNGAINVYNLTLDARDSGNNTTGDVVMSAAAGALNVTAANTFTLYAGNDVTISAGAAAGQNVAVSANYLDSYVGHDFVVHANGGSAAVNAPSQSITTGNDLQVLGGSVGIAGASATLASTGNQDFNVGGNLLVQGGSASGSAALLQGSSYQSFSVYGNFSVLGGSGNGASATVTALSQYFTALQSAVAIEGGSGTNAFAEIVASNGSQNLGNQDTYYYRPTSSILISGGTGAGAFASATATGFQTLEAAGNITVLGGSGSGANATVSSSGSGQSIGSTSDYYSAATQNILVAAGAGGSASITANGNQTIMGGGNITVQGGSAANMTASIVSTTGSQTIGDASTNYNQPTQNVSVLAGTAAGTSATIIAATGQAIDAGGAITITGGPSGAFARVATAAGTQTIGNANGGYENTQSITVTGGSGSGGKAELIAGADQTLYAVDAVTVSNPGSDSAQISAAGNQTINAGSVSVTQNSPLANAVAGILAGGNQTITLAGIAGTATLTVANFDAASGSIAEVRAGGNQVIAMPYNTVAGELGIGGTTTQGESLLYAGGTQTLVTGEIIIQGGATSGASAVITSVGDSTMSALNGSVEVLGGAAGSAAIDPPNLNLITNGAVIVTAGNAASATATITAGNINIGATNGNILVTGGTVAGAAAGISANGTPGTLNMFGSGNLIFTANAGGATASALSPTGNTIELGGTCVGCATDLIGNFNLVTNQLPGVLPPVIPTPPGNSSSEISDTLADASMGDISALLDYLQDLYGLLDAPNESDITLDLAQLQLPQCN